MEVEVRLSKGTKRAKGKGGEDGYTVAVCVCVLSIHLLPFRANVGVHFLPTDQSRVWALVAI